MWYHKVTAGSRTKRSATRTGLSEDKELWKIGRCIAKNTVPDDRGDSITDALLNWEPVEHVPISAVNRT